jgi:hypothetical protein
MDIMIRVWFYRLKHCSALRKLLSLPNIYINSSREILIAVGKSSKQWDGMNKDEILLMRFI